MTGGFAIFRVRVKELYCSETNPSASHVDANYQVLSISVNQSHMPARSINNYALVIQVLMQILLKCCDNTCLHHFHRQSIPDCIHLPGNLSCILSNALMLHPKPTPSCLRHLYHGLMVLNILPIYVSHNCAHV